MSLHSYDIFSILFVKLTIKISIVQECVRNIWPFELRGTASSTSMFPEKESKFLRQKTAVVLIDLVPHPADSDDNRRPAISETRFINSVI